MIAVGAGHALHLAIARRMGARLGSLDHRQAIGAEGLGIPIIKLKQCESTQFIHPNPTNGSGQLSPFWRQI